MLALLADIVAVFAVCTAGILDMCAIETLLHGLEHHSIFERNVHMGVRCSLMTYFIAHTPIQATGQSRQNILDDVVREAFIGRIVDGDLVLAIC